LPGDEVRCRACDTSHSPADLFRCSVCGSWNRQTSQAELAAEYATAWCAPQTSAHAVGSTDKRNARQLLDALVQGRTQGLRILDYGAGTGAVARELAVRRAEVTAFEPYGNDPEVAGVHWVRERATILRSGPFDQIFLIEVIEHVDDPVGTLTELRNLLSPGGHVTITTPNAGGLHARLTGKKWREVENPTHICLFTPAGLRICATRSGYSSVVRDFEPIAYGHSRVRDALGTVLQRIALDGSLRIHLR
jgi:2-polyprenyl-3-methyl-5-hydroxy-6-metoxy-1,4-benzoquinol methylase